MADSELVTISEAALALRVSAPTLRRRIGRGTVRAVQVGGPGHAVRIKRSDLDRLVEARPSSATAEGEAA